jgi:integrase
LIDLRNPDIKVPHNGRAICPMNRTVKVALLGAKQGALTDHVIEWGGRAVKSVKRGLKRAAKLAAIDVVSPHMLRHSAAVHMAEAGISMEEIARYLGHSDVNLTRRVYVRFSPTYLCNAAAVLEYDDLAHSCQRELRKSPLSVIDFMVGAAGIEPATPTMST